MSLKNTFRRSTENSMLEQFPQGSNFVLTKRGSPRFIDFALLQNLIISRSMCRVKAKGKPSLKYVILDQYEGFLNSAI